MFATFRETSFTIWLRHFSASGKLSTSVARKGRF
jgi:hypothetical protein